MEGIFNRAVAMNRVFGFLMFDRLYRYFADDPLRLLTLIGGSGGLLYWWDRFRSRPRVRFYRLKDVFHVPGSGDYAQIRFEAENVGSEPTSLEPTVAVVAYTTHARPYSLRYRIAFADRSLPSHVPKEFTAVAELKADSLPFLWFRSYLFVPTRGRAIRVRVRNVAGKRLSRYRYVLELLYFRVMKCPLVDDTDNCITFDA